MSGNEGNIVENYEDDIIRIMKKANYILDVINGFSVRVLFGTTIIIGISILPKLTSLLIKNLDKDLDK